MKKIIIPIVILLIILGGAGIGYSYYSSKELYIEIETNIELKLNEEYHLLDAIKKLKNGTIITEDKIIDTTKIGNEKLEIEVKDHWNRIQKHTYNIIVIDDEAPVITSKEKITITEGEKVDLLKGVTAKDNSNEEIKVTIEGEYNINKPKEYTLYYVAKDSSNNETKKEFKLVVNKKPEIKKEEIVGDPKKETTTKPNTNTTTVNKDGTFTTSKGFTGYTKNGVTYIDGVLIANKTYSLPSTYGTGLTSTTKNAFTKMQAAAKKDGYQIHIQSGYRSYASQKTIYNNYVNRDGKAKADTYSARPGHSEHQTGLAFDVCSHDLDGKNACINDNFNSTKQAEWLSKNAYKYGFILRYPKGKTNETGYKYESWHFRYVGVELATKLYNNGNWITLEDYFGITSEYQN